MRPVVLLMAPPTAPEVALVRNVWRLRRTACSMRFSTVRPAEFSACTLAGRFPHRILEHFYRMPQIPDILLLHPQPLHPISNARGFDAWWGLLDVLSIVVGKEALVVLLPLLLTGEVLRRKVLYACVRRELFFILLLPLRVDMRRCFRPQ